MANNSNVFVRLASGLPERCRAPAVRTDADLQSQTSQLMAFKRLAYALAARSRLAALEGQTNEAAEKSLDGVQMGLAISRGSVLIGALVGMACEHQSRHP